MVAVAIGIGAAGALSAGGSILAANTASAGAQKAAQTEAAAQQAGVTAEEQMYAQGSALQQQDLQTAIQQAQNYYGTASGLEQPFISMGQGIGNELTGELTGGAPVPGQPGALGAMPSLTDMSQLPGYNFTLQQGLLATQNAAAAQGLGVSGVALKGASQYAENTANTFYNNYLQNYWANQNNRYNMLAGIMGTGATTASNLGGQAVNTGGNIASAAGAAGNAALSGAVNTGQNIAGTTTGTAAAIAQTQQAAANAQAAGITGASNSLSSGVTNALLANALMQGAPGSTLPALNPANQNQSAGFTTYTNDRYA